MLKNISLFVSFSLIFLFGCGNMDDKNDPEIVNPLEESSGDEKKLTDTQGFSFEKLDENLEVIKTTDEFKHKIEYSRNKKDFAKNGLFICKDSLGRLLEAAYYVNDTLHGSRTLFYAETGKKQIVEHYRKGNFDGIFQSYYPNGVLEQQGNYIVNVMDSIWVRYYDNAQLKEEVMFRDNEENGPFKEYYENGNLKAEGYYKNGDHEHGLLKLYDESGELVKTMNCKNGMCKTIWKKEEMQ